MKNWQKESNGFWDKLDSWRQLPKKNMNWKKNWLQNEFCGDCKLCCGPQGKNDPPFPMPLLERQIGPDTPENFYLLDAQTPYIGVDGCKSASAKGCCLSAEKKPIACGLFPLVLINGKLYLYQNCPAALFTPIADFMTIAKKAGEFLITYKLADLERISIHLPCEVLATKYIDMHITIFDESGINPELK